MNPSKLDKRIRVLLVYYNDYTVQPDNQRPWGPIYKISYDNLTIMPKLRSTYDERLIYKTSCEGRKAILRYDLLAKL